MSAVSTNSGMREGEEGASCFVDLFLGLTRGYNCGSVNFLFHGNL